MKIEIGGGGIVSTLGLFLIVGVFIPELYVVVAMVWLAIWAMGLVVDSQVKQAMDGNSSSKIHLNVPVISSRLSDETEEEKIELAVAEAKRIAQRMPCGHEERKWIFERVFRLKCEQRGVKISNFAWRERAQLSSESELESSNFVL